MDDAAFIARFASGGGRAPHPGAYVQPDLVADWAAFGAMLTAVGGTLLPIARSRVALAETVAGAMAFAPGRTVAAGGAPALLAEVDGWQRPDPGPGHGLADVGLGIVTARLAVAENAAVLVEAAALPERALLVLAEHLLVLVPEGALVGGFTEAHRQVDAAGHYATWLSGPSKTADIEQTLVIGAHGARSLAVLPYAGC